MALYPARATKRLPRSAGLLARLRETSGSEIVEFVVSLPLIMVTVVGIFDFGSAFVVRQKLSYAALQGARVASNQPTSDLTTAGAAPCNAPGTICALRDVIDSTLVKSRLNDCGLATAGATSGTPLDWTFTANTGCPGNLSVKIERGFTYDTTLPSPPFQANYRIEATRVTISYPYRWQFNRVISLLVPGANYPSISQIKSVGVMQNLN